MLLLQGCEHKVNILGQYSSDYHKNLRHQTRSKGAYTIEKVRFETQVVFLNEALRRAYVNEFANKYRLSEEEKQQLLQEQLAENEENYTFLVFHFSNNHKLSKIEKNAHNWKVRMVQSDGSLATPKRIQDLQGDALMLSYFYPQITPWSRNYRVHFPKQDESMEQLTLNLDSVEANLSFHWKN
ncbi:MAG TPA: hypothetical protein PKB05_07000 [Oligoflexia bacterium]|nr:hypothetical protein [Oligoflexia bacterium]